MSDSSLFQRKTYAEAARGQLALHAAQKLADCGKAARHGRPLFAVIGNIGATKTTLSEALSKRIEGLACVSEPVEQWIESGLLSANYTEKSRVYDFQQFVITTRLSKVLHAASRRDARAFVCDGHTLVDREVYAQARRDMGEIGDVQWSIYSRTHDILHDLPSSHANVPTYWIFLDTTPEQCLRNIKARILEEKGREEESNISLDYLRRLDGLLQKFVQKPEVKARLIHLNGNRDRHAIASEATRAILKHEPSLRLDLEATRLWWLGGASEKSTQPPPSVLPFDELGAAPSFGVTVAS
jgi:deoxyadenosine/deoxycytidine kinase